MFNRVLLIIVSLFSSIFALDVPKLQGRVNDYANLLNSTQKNHIDSLIKDFETKNSTQIVVLTIRSLEGQILEEYSLKVAEDWGIGQKDIDNGVLLLISKNDRKIRIEVGNGLEGTLTDVLCSRIIRNVIVPNFKKGNFGQGIYDGVSAIASVVDGTYKSNSKLNEDSEWEENVQILSYLFTFIFTITLISWLLITGHKIGEGKEHGISEDNFSDDGDSISGFGGSSGGYSGGGGGFSGGGSSGGW